MRRVGPSAAHIPSNTPQVICRLWCFLNHESLMDKDVFDEIVGEVGMGSMQWCVRCKLLTEAGSANEKKLHAPANIISSCDSIVRYVFLQCSPYCMMCPLPKTLVWAPVRALGN